MVQVTLGTLVPGLGSVTQPAKGSLEGLDSVTAVFVSPVEITVGILHVWRGFQCDLSFKLAGCRRFPPFCSWHAQAPFWF